MTKVSAAPHLGGGHLCFTRCCSVLGNAGNSTRAQHWKQDFCTGVFCVFRTSWASQGHLALQSPLFPTPASALFCTHSLQRLEGSSFTCCCQTQELGSLQVQRKCRLSKYLWFKIYSSKKEICLSLWEDRAKFSYFCREDYTHQGRAMPTWEFLYRYIFEEAAPGINCTHYQGTDRQCFTGGERRGKKE